MSMKVQSDVSGSITVNLCKDGKSKKVNMKILKYYIGLCMVDVETHEQWARDVRSTVHVLS